MHVGTQFSQHYLLRRLFVSHCVFLEPLLKISWMCIWFYSWDLYSILLASAAAAAAAKSLQSCPTLCNPIEGSPSGSPVPGILQARTLEWVAISFSNAGKWKVKVKSLSRVLLLATPWTAAYQAPPFTGFSRQEYWSGVPSPSLLLASMSVLMSVPYFSYVLLSHDSFGWVLLWFCMWRVDSLEKTDVGRDWGQEEKGTTEDEMAGWHHWLDGCEVEWTPGVGDGQGGLACCNSWGRKESDTTERLNWTELNWWILELFFSISIKNVLGILMDLALNL